MSVLLDYFWPVFAAGIVFGVIGGTVGFRLKVIRRRGEEVRFVRPPGRRRLLSLIAGVAASIVFAALWHGPLGGADRFSAAVEQEIQRTLVYYEMTQVSAHLHHAPLTRRVLLSGPADDFQRSELVRLIDQIPGVSSATWSPDGGGTPLIAEGAAVSILGFLFGLLLAYLVELRRRYNAQWSW